MFHEARPLGRLLGGIQSDRFTESIFIGDSIKARNDCLSAHVAYPGDNPKETGNNPTQFKLNRFIQDRLSSL